LPLPGQAVRKMSRLGVYGEQLMRGQEAGLAQRSLIAGRQVLIGGHPLDGLDEV
jgi:hypothetical protein